MHTYAHLCKFTHLQIVLQETEGRIIDHRGCEDWLGEALSS